MEMVMVVAVVVMQRSGVDWASMLHPWSVKRGKNPSYRMLLLPLSHTNTSVKK